jgi:hypothetical protein
MGGGNPIEIAPYFAAVDLFGLSGGGKFLERFQTGEENADMSLVAIGRVVEVEDLGASSFEDFDEICHDGGPIGLADGSAGVAELKNGGVVSEVGGVMLFSLAEGNEF